MMLLYLEDNVNGYFLSFELLYTLLGKGLLTVALFGHKTSYGVPEELKAEGRKRLPEALLEERQRFV